MILILEVMSVVVKVEVYRFSIQLSKKSVVFRINKFHMLKF